MKKIFKSFFLGLVFILPLGKILGDEHDYDISFWADCLSIGPVTVEQARENIISWAGRQNLVINLEPISEWIEHPARSSSGVPWIGEDIIIRKKQCYAFTIQDPNSDKKYSGTAYVDSYTGKVVRFSTGRKFELDLQGDVTNMLPPQTIISRAKQFVRAYFPHVPIDEFTYGLHYSFFTQTIDENGNISGASRDVFSLGDEPWQAFSPTIYVSFGKTLPPPAYGEPPIWIDFQFAHVCVDSQTGDLCDITCVYEPVEVSLKPSINSDEAAQIVLSHFYGLGYQNVAIIEGNAVRYGWYIIECIAPNGPQRLSRCFTVEAWKNNWLQSFVVYVDAHTGEIWYGDSSGGGPLSKKEYSKRANKGQFIVTFNGKVLRLREGPVELKGGVYLPIKEIENLGFQIMGKDKRGYILTNKKLKIQIPSNQIISKGKTKYINVFVLGKIKDVMVSYDKELKRLNIWIKNEKVFREAEQLSQKIKNKIPVSHHSQIPLRESSPIPCIIAAGLVLTAGSFLAWKFSRYLA